MQKKMVKLSVITPVFNEEMNLVPFYESLYQQKLPPHVILADIFAVDNGSIDASATIASVYCTKVFIRPGDTVADLRNYGALQSSGDMLLFVDADCILAEDNIWKTILLLQENNAVAVGPNGYIPYGRPTWVERIWYLHLKKSGNENNSAEVKCLSSGFLAVKADKFRAARGFNGSLSVGEDTDLSRRLLDQGFKLIRSSLLQVYNSGQPRTLREFIKREYWHGDSFCHLLIHKRLELLTAYFFINALIIVTILIMLAEAKYVLTIAVVVMACIAPAVKSVIKARNFNLDTARLFLLYIVYINTRTIALFKLK